MQTNILELPVVLVQEHGAACQPQQQRQHTPACERFPIHRRLAHEQVSEHIEPGVAHQWLVGNEYQDDGDEQEVHHQTGDWRPCLGRQSPTHHGR